MSGWEKGEGKEEKEGDRPSSKGQNPMGGAQARRVFFKDTRNERRQGREGSQGLAGKRAEIQNGNLPKQQLGRLQKTQLRHENMGKKIKTPNRKFRCLLSGGCGKPLRTSFYVSPGS